MMTRFISKTKISGADNPLQGKPPAINELNNDTSRNPNASFHVENKPEWKSRPAQYPAAKQGLGNPDIRNKKEHSVTHNEPLSPILSNSQRTVGQRPDGGSARIVEPASDDFFPTAVPVERKGEDHLPRMAHDPHIIEKGYASLPNEDHALTGGAGDKTRKGSG